MFRPFVTDDVPTMLAAAGYPNWRACKRCDGFRVVTSTAAFPDGSIDVRVACRECFADETYQFPATNAA